jgi:hypothetical protein
VSVFWFIVGLLTLWRVIASVRPRRRAWEQRTGGAPSRRRPCRHHRPGDGKRRRLAREQARDLVGTLLAGGHDPVVHLAAGVVLEAGEVAWQRSMACLSVWSTESSWITRSRISWLGRRAHSASSEVVVSGWRDYGGIDWLITSARLVGRAPTSGELISIWWAGLSGVQVNLDAGVVSLDAANGWRAEITGPGVAPIAVAAVAAVAACHGPASLVGHPGLACLRGQSVVAEASRGPEPPVLGTGEPVLRGPWLAGTTPERQPPRVPPPRAP